MKSNDKDLNFVKSKKIKDNLIERLKINEKKINEILISINNIIKLKDPCNKILESWKDLMVLIFLKLHPLGVLV